MAPKKHALLGASKAERWMNCAGSVQAALEAPPQETSEFAAEGTAAHELVEWCLNDATDAQYHFGRVVQVSDRKGGKFEFEVDEEMATAAQEFLDAVRGVGGQLLIEQKFSLDAIAPPELKGLLYGTADAIVVAPPVLHVFDLKYGKGIVVDVEDNAQLMYYALGALLQTERDHPEYRGKITTIRMTIVQPRAYHAAGTTRSVEIGYLDLVSWAQVLIRKARETQAAGAPRKAGRWCRFCPAHATCPEVHAAAQETAMVAFEAMPVDAPPAPETLPMEVLTDVLDKVDILEDWIRSVRRHVQGELERGVDVPGWKLVPRRTHRKWVNEEHTLAEAMKEGIQKEDLVTLKLKSPAQLEKEYKKHGLVLPEDLYFKPDGGHTLAPSGDPRPALPASTDAFEADQ